MAYDTVVAKSNAKRGARNERREARRQENGTLGPRPDIPQARRFTLEDVDEWLLGRLDEMWPGRPENHWRSRLAEFTRTNDYLFVTNGPAVLCVMQLRHAMSGQPIAIEVFGWSRAAHLTKDHEWSVLPGEDETPLTQLYSHAQQWLRGMNGFRLIAGTCSDLPPGGLKDLLGGRYLVDIR